MTAIRFHLDEHVHPGITVGLRAQGIDTTTSQEAGILAADDPDQLRHATAEDRVLVTHDDDFTKLHASGTSHAGICYCHQIKYGVGELLQALLLVHGCLTAEEMRDHLEYL